MAKCYASQDCIVRVNGAPIGVKEGQAFDPKDPVVREYPWLFATDVEQATAAPGERRTTRRS